MFPNRRTSHQTEAHLTKPIQVLQELPYFQTEARLTKQKHISPNRYKYYKNYHISEQKHISPNRYKYYKNYHICKRKHVSPNRSSSYQTETSLIKQDQILPNKMECNNRTETSLSQKHTQSLWKPGLSSSQSTVRRFEKRSTIRLADLDGKIMTF